MIILIRPALPWVDFGDGAGLIEIEIPPEGPQGPPGVNGIDGASNLTKVRAVATGSEDPATDFQPGDVIDGVGLLQNDVVLRASKTNAKEKNGVWIVPASGAATRHTSFDTYAELVGAMFLVKEGTYHDTLWVVTSDVAGTINVTAVDIESKNFAYIISPEDFGAVRTGLVNDFSRFQLAYDAGRAAKASPNITEGLYLVNGDIVFAPDSIPFVAKPRSYLKGHSNVTTAVKETFPYTKFDPTITHVTIMDGMGANPPDGLYNHVPWMARGMRDTGASFDRLWAVWNGHPSSNLEGTDNKRCYLKWSDDNGATWEPASPVELAVDPTYTNNPIIPGAIYNQPCIIKVGAEIWAFSNNNKTTAGWDDDSLIWSRLTTVNDLWTNYRFRESTSTDAISWSDTDLSGPPDAGFRIRHPYQGTNFILCGQCVKVMSNGRVVLLVSGVDPTFGITHKNLVFSCLQDGTDWRFESALPNNAWWPDAAWELSVHEDAAGLFVVIARRLALTAAQTSQERFQVFVSHDLKSWSEARNFDSDTSSVRPFFEQVSPRRWMGSLPIGTLRERLSLLLSGDGRNFTFGTPLSNEAQNDGFPAYSHSLRGENCIYFTYAIGAVTGPSDPRDIRMARVDFAMNERELYAMTTDRGAVTSNNAAYASDFVGDDLVINLGRGLGSLETRGERYAVSLVWRLETNPASGNEYRIASIGNFVTRADLTLLYVSSGIYVLQVNGRTVQIISDATEEQITQVVVDTVDGWVEVAGRHVNVPGQIRLYLGDPYTLVTADQSGDLLFDISKMSLQILDRAAGAKLIPAVATQNGPNLCLNSGFYHNEPAALALMPDGWFRDIAGGTITTQQVTFSLAAANAQYGGWRHGYRHQATVAAGGFSRFWTQWDDVSFMSGKVVTVAFDAYDASGLSYDLFVSWLQNFGSGGSTEVETAIFHVPIGPVNRRYSFTLRVPLISSAATVGTLPIATVRWRLPTHTTLCNLIITKVDIYEGAYDRDWMTPDPLKELPELQRQFQRLTVNDSNGPFLGGGIAISSTVARFVVRYAVPMRKDPSLSISPAAGSFELFTPSGAITATAIAIGAAGSHSANIDVTVASGLTTGQTSQLRAKADATAQLRFNAR